ncbi:MAG: hypothetical protein ACYDD0_00925 [Candidatus Dormibacteria bacterium]
MRGRLTEYPLEDVVDAAKGIWLDTWHVGHQRTDLIYAMRDVERFRDIQRGLLSGAPVLPSSPSDEWGERANRELEQAMANLERERQTAGGEA